MNPFKITPSIFGWSLWWIGPKYYTWKRDRSYSIPLGLFSLEKCYVG